MKIAVTIHYEAMCKPPGSSGYKGRFYETVEVEIAETTTADAPVATETRHGEKTRWFADRHFLPRHDQERLEGQPSLSTSEILETLENGSVYSMTDGYGCFDWKTRPSKYEASRYAEFDDRARQKAIDEAHLCYDRMLLVDGEFWIECAEPYILREEFVTNVCHDFLTDNDSGRPNHRHHHWLMNSKIDRADSQSAEGYITVLIPESIKRQPERDTIIDAAKAIIEDYSYTHLADVHPYVFKALADVHALYAGRTRDEIDCDALVEPINWLVTEMERKEREPRIANPSKLDGYRKAVQRWVDRDVSINDILPADKVTPRL
ncbi:hypothetical protein [Rhizobium sp. BK176]|uniref:hypothetical protein n=1 Tax=Rhizobium sp. BK176 TaxID=2587071 RepID=UPI002168F0E1|nr:hypothetical protein [Rhizobium sp. BK176]MCS4088857.1 hypothetical protein [Rhizobium sp. BK176]